MDSSTTTYRIAQDKRGELYIQCLVCGARSYHPTDISEHYCGNCHQFHSILEMQAATRQN